MRGLAGRFVASIGLAVSLFCLAHFLQSTETLCRPSAPRSDAFSIIPPAPPFDDEQTGPRVSLHNSKALLFFSFALLFFGVPLPSGGHNGTRKKSAQRSGTVSSCFWRSSSAGSNVADHFSQFSISSFFLSEHFFFLFQSVTFSVARQVSLARCIGLENSCFFLGKWRRKRCGLSNEK